MTGRRRVPGWHREALRTTLWLVPTVMVVAVTALFVVTYAVDRAADDGLVRLPRPRHPGNPGGVRVDLCVLRPDPGAVANHRGREFVPNLSITVALALTLGSVGVLIYFIHHVVTSIQLTSVVSSIARDFQVTVDELFREEAELSTGPGPTGLSPSEVVPRMDDDGATVAATASGFLQAVGHGRLVRIASGPMPSSACSTGPATSWSKAGPWPGLASRQESTWGRHAANVTCCSARASASTAVRHSSLDQPQAQPELYHRSPSGPI